MVVVFEKRVSVELNHLISNAATAELIADGLGDEHDNLYRRGQLDGGADVQVLATDHGRENVGQSARELKHDDNDRDRDASDASAKCVRQRARPVSSAGSQTYASPAAAPMKA